MPILFLESPVDPRSPQRSRPDAGLVFERFEFSIVDPTRPERPAVSVRDLTDTEGRSSGLALRAIDTSKLEDWPSVHAAVISGRAAWEDPWFERPDHLFVVRSGPVPPEIDALPSLGSGPLRLIEVPRGARTGLFDRLFRRGNDKLALIADPTPELLASEVPLRIDGPLAQIARAKIRFDRLGVLLRSCAWVAASHDRVEPAPRCFYAARDLGPALREMAGAEPFQETLDRLSGGAPPWPGPELVLDGPPGIDEERLRRSVGIERLSIRGVKLTSFTVLAELTRLDHLALDRLPLAGSTGVGTLRSLRSVDLSAHRGDPGFLEDLPALERLVVNDTLAWPRLRTVLGSLCRLRHLSIDHPEVDDLDWLPATLEGLTLARARVPSIAGLARVAGLRELSIDSVPVTDLSPLSSLPALNRVGIARCRVSDLSPLAALPALRHLALELVPVRDWATVGRLDALESLRVAFVELPSLELLRGVRSLRSLELVDSGVRDVAPLGALDRLEHVRWVGPPPHDLDRLDPRVRVELVS